MSTFSRLPSLQLDCLPADPWVASVTAAPCFVSPLASTTLAAPAWPSPQPSLAVDQLFSMEALLTRAVDSGAPAPAAPAPALAAIPAPTPASSTVSGFSGSSLSEQAPTPPQPVVKQEMKPFGAAAIEVDLKDSKPALPQAPVLFSREIDSKAIEEARRITTIQTEQRVNECRERSVQIRGTAGRRPGAQIAKGQKSGRYNDRLKLNQLYSSVARNRQKKYITNLEDTITDIEKRAVEVAAQIKKLRCENDVIKTTLDAVRRSGQ